jgi:homoserine kinase
MSKTIKVKAPASIANLACGFDVLGLAINEPFDTIELEMLDERKVEIASIEGYNSLSYDSNKNVVGPVLHAILNSIEKPVGFRVRIRKGIAPGSGIGSSAASAAAAAFAANTLLGNRFSSTEMVAFAMEGEKLASGSAHADNVAPALLGGITLVRGYDPLDVVPLAVPAELYAVVLHPEIVVKTIEARKVLPESIPLKDAIRQWGNLGGLVAGLHSGNYELIGRSLTDYVAEPKRANLIPGFFDLKRAAMENGALGAGISGSGPSVFALCKGEVNAMRVCNAMEFTMRVTGVGFKTHISAINRNGTTVC